ncbi:MAG: general stress protein [Caldilineaceae bacterium]
MTLETQSPTTIVRNHQVSDGRSNELRRLVATYTTYGEAQRAVDYLADQRFPVQRIAIVAEGLRFEEQVTGRLSWGRALLNGALGGAATGIFIGFIFGLFSLVTPLVSALTLALYGLFFGAIVGALFGLLFYAFSGGQRDFTSVGNIRAEHYDVVADEDVAAQAERLLATMSSTQ